MAFLKNALWIMGVCLLVLLLLIIALKPSTVIIKGVDSFDLKKVISESNFSVVTDTIPSSNFLLEVAKGNVDGHSSINKFGHNPTANAGDDIWGGDGLYNFYPATAQSVDIVSTSSEDGVGGTGAISVMVFGLDANWLEQSEMVTLNGTTPVNLNKTYIRLFRAFVYEAGSGNSNVGDITVEIQGDSTVGVFIPAASGQTLQCIYTIPADKEAYFIKGYVGLGTLAKTSENGVFRWLMRMNNGVNGAWLTQGEVGLTNLGSSYWQYEYGIPAGAIAGKTDIRISLDSSSQEFDTVCGFDLLLVDV